jgi:hypothetical protein
MLGKTILCSACVLFMIACNPPRVSDHESKSSILFAGSFDRLKALKAIYGELTPLKGSGREETALWRNIDVPKPLAKYFQSESKGIVRVVFDAPFKEDGIDKHVIITATAPADKDYQCHACELLIGGAVFRRSAGGWLIESQNKYVAAKGKYGSMEGEIISLLDIGPAKYGVLIRGTDSHQGYVANYVSLLVPYEKSINEALMLSIEGPSEGVCEDAVWEQDIELKSVKSQKESPEYFDMDADYQYNDGECGEVESVKETEHFRFAKGKYVKAK